ncbi:MAG TPA: hypothetical protein VLB87_01880, partial [Pyrinomonadaceae bacterium]|nr:hypothetical protein [Pyrinomonadaceae bacterium]
MAGSGRLESQAPSGGFQLVRRRHTFFIESESLVFFQQPFALAAKVFVLITVLNGSEVLFGSEDKTTCQNETAEQQQRQTGERCRVACAANLRVKLVFGKSFHVSASRVIREFV